MLSERTGTGTRAQAWEDATRRAVRNVGRVLGPVVQGIRQVFGNATQIPAVSDESLLPDVPDDIKDARIGSCYNQLTRQIMEASWAIVPSLATSDQVKFVKGKGELTVTANSSAVAAASSTVFNLATTVKGGYDTPVAGVDASLSFNMQNSQASSHEDEHLSVFCSYFFYGQRQELNMAMDPDELFKIMSPTFVDKYNAVVAATTADDYVKAYLAFTDTFGHGCVTTVYLGAGSAFRLTFQHTDTASTNRQKYGGSVSVSGYYGGGHGGASVATDWAKEQQTANASTTLDLVLDNVPEDTPTAEWVNSMQSTFLNITTAGLVQKANLIAAPANEPPIQAPEPLHGNPDPTRSAPGNPQVDPSDKGINEALQQKLMDEDGFPGTWEEYKDAQKKAYESLKPEGVVTEVNEIVQQARELAR